VRPKNHVYTGQLGAGLFKFAKTVKNPGELREP